MRGTRALGRILACCAALAVCAPPAHAGTYDVWGCRLPDGTPAPINGWAPIEPLAFTTTNTCDSPGGGLKVAVEQSSGTGPAGATGWFFSAPDNLRIENFTLFRRVEMSGVDPRIYELFYDAADRRVEICSTVAGCGALGTEAEAFAPANRAEGQQLSLVRLGVSLTCHVIGGCSPSDPASYVVVFSSRMGLSDTSRPTFLRGPVGPLMAMDRPVTSEQEARYAAEDEGGGLARVAVVVDGVVRKDQPAASGGPGCHGPYVQLVPCPLSSEGAISFDTAVLPDGPHSVAVALIDAAGNRTVSDATTVVFRNRRVANGVNASRSAKMRTWFRVGGKSRASRTVSFGRRAPVFGTLTTGDGTPIRDAAIEVTSTPRSAGATAEKLSPVTTDERGRFAFTPSRGPSRRFTLAYRAFDTDSTPAATAELTLDVRAGVALRVAPRRTTTRGRISFNGRLLGGPNRDGTQVQLLAVARKGHDRVPVATLRADRRGRFRFSYRFRRTFAPFTYYFQAVVQRQNGYPYATGKSKRVTVRIVR